MRALYSIRPKWVEKILNKEKKWEIRKDCPSRLKPPFTALIYCTRAKSKWRFWNYEGAYENSKGEVVYAQQHIIGEFTCDKIEKIVFAGNRYLIADKDKAYTSKVAKESCLDFYDLDDYLGDKGGYALHISDLKIYDKPKELSEFSKVCPYYDDCENCKHKSENCQEWREIKRPPESWGYIR